MFGTTVIDSRFIFLRDSDYGTREIQFNILQRNIFLVLILHVFFLEEGVGSTLFNFRKIHF